MKNSFFTVYIEQDEDGVFVGSVPSIPSCYAQGKTQEEMLDNLRDVLKLGFRKNQLCRNPKLKSCPCLNSYQ